ncbi:hypothetical protein F4779DRAFT_617886 [Xylariaceae sp. FL0662B]|nr:hypothetical protein F4779DRAFT_617886 [Xylariaceae sp. FL0662B]
MVDIVGSPDVTSEIDEYFVSVLQALAQIASQGRLGRVEHSILRTLDVAKDGTHYFPGGPLYRGPPAVCLRLWGFWQSRLEELGQLAGLREEIRKAALGAAETTGTTERRLANTL